MSEERITMTTLYKKVGRRYKPVAEHEAAAVELLTRSGWTCVAPEVAA